MHMTHFKQLLMAAGMLAVAAIGAQAQAPKYIFYFIGDGMGMGPVMAAQTYKRVVRADAEPLTMMQFPVVAWCQTWSASSTTTDSAAAGTALSTGTKTRNGMLGVAPDSTAVTSIAADLHNMGWGVGITTSVAADDATPGAFYA
ncbi:MAG: alkaline phosphatase, partial [Muribaculaceae bacterium]|nr:alkaline phosphatase [Muribaculaceae bacterium]